MEAHVKMETHNLPCAKIPRFGNTTGMVSIASPSIGLGLGLGPRKSGFTFLQLQELEHQALIFKYMVAGVPVPFHLVLPIWKSVVSSSGGVYKHHHPSYISCSSFCFDCRNNMEPEPGRCRRTDGKKWRCSKDVVAGQKYCERHMHRGRHRSRKPVEGHLTTTTTNSIDHSNTHLSISIPVGLELMTTNTTPSSILQSNTVKTESCS